MLDRLCEGLDGALPVFAAIGELHFALGSLVVEVVDDHLQLFNRCVVDIVENVFDVLRKTIVKRLLIGVSLSDAVRGMATKNWFLSEFGDQATHLVFP